MKAGGPFYAAFVFAMAAGPAHSAAAADPQGARGLAGTTISSLPNGLTVVVLEDHALPVVSLQIAYRLDGSRSASGLQLLAPRIMLDGTSHVPRGQYGPLLAVAGGRGMGWETRLDSDVFRVTVPSNQVELPLWLWSDQMAFTAPNLDASRLSQATALSLEDRHMRVDETPCDASEDEMRQALYPGRHPYGHTPHGVPDSVTQVTVDEARRYVQSEFVPRRAAVVLVGDIGKGAALALAAKWFGDIAPGAPGEEISEALPTADTEILASANVDAPRLHVTWRIPSSEDRPFEWEALQHLLTGEEVSILSWRVRDDLKLVSKITADYSRREHGSVFTIDAIVAKGHDTTEVLAAIDTFLAGLDPQAQQMHIEWARREVERTRRLERQTTSGRAALLTRAWVFGSFDRDRAESPAFDAASLTRLLGHGLVLRQRAVFHCRVDAQAPIVGSVDSRTHHGAASP